MSASPSPEPRPKKVTPFLCRIFLKSGGYHPIEAFQQPESLPLSDEYGVYVWKSTTLSEIIASLYPSLPPALQHPATRFALRTVYFDGRAAAGDDRAPPGGRAWKSRELGRVEGRDLIRQLGETTHAKTLEEHRYQAGDYLCISAHLPEAAPVGGAVQRGMNIRTGPPGPRDSWGAEQPRGGFGIRGRGAPRGGGGGGWGRRSASPSRPTEQSGGWGTTATLAEDSWGAPKADGEGWGAVPRGEDKDSSAGWGAKTDGW